MDEVNQNEKTIVFCASQDHAAMVRDLINQYKKSVEVNYCVRVTANDGEIGEQFLRKFQNNERTIPTILTTSQKLSTGVDARHIRNIVASTRTLPASFTNFLHANTRELPTFFARLSWVK
jgi:type I restriction enzyme R subunit